MNGETIKTETEDILFVPANLKYTKDKQAELFYVIHFYCDELCGEKLMRLSPRYSEEFRKLFEQLHFVQTKKEPVYEHDSKQLFYMLVGNIEREWAATKNTDAKNHMERAIKNMHECFMYPDFSVESLAQEANMSEKYFRRIFQKSTGMSPK